MEFAYLSGRAAPAAVAAALEAELVFAHPDALLVLREGDRTVSPARLLRRGARRVLYRLAFEPEVPARRALEEGWIDGLADDESAVRRALENSELSFAARRAAGRLLDAPSLSAALALERAEFALIQAAGDKEEGIAAFFEKRAPRFANR